MIDEKATKKQFGYLSTNLPPGTSKPIIVICVLCKKKLQIRRNNYKDNYRCHSCAIANKALRTSKDDIAKDIARVAKDLGHQPTSREYVKFGKYAFDTLVRVFKKGWRETLLELGYVLVRRKNDTYTFDQVKADLIAVKQKLGHIPGMKEYSKHGKISYPAIKRVTNSNSWQEITIKIFSITQKTAKKFAPGAREKDHTPKLLQLQQLAQKLGYTPSSSEARRNGIDTRILRKCFGSNWTNVILAAGLDPNKLPQLSISHLVDNKDIINDVLRVAHTLGKCPRFSDYEKHGKFGRKILKNRFGSWPQVLAATNLSVKQRYEAYKSGIYKPTEYYLERLKDLAHHLGRAPTTSEAAKHGIRCWQLNERLNTNWAGVLKIVGLESKGLRSHVLSMSTQEAIDSIKTVAISLGHLPTRAEYKQYGDVSLSTIQRRLLGKTGSWNSVLTSCHFDPNFLILPNTDLNATSSTTEISLSLSQTQIQLNQDLMHNNSVKNITNFFISSPSTHDS